MRRRRPNLLPAAFFQKVYYCKDQPPSAPVDLHAFDNNYRELNPEKVDPIVKNEFNKFMKKFEIEEKAYIHQELTENPIIWYKNRNSTETLAGCDANSPNCNNSQDIPNCARCKMIGKITKAKRKLRHKFLFIKLEQNANTLQNLRNFVASAEAKLKMRGRTDQDLQQVRDALGIDRVRVDNLPEINRQFFRAAENAPE